MSGRRRNAGDRLALSGALALLVAVLAGWWLLSLQHERVREETLLQVPEFPKPGQTQTRREPQQHARARPAPPAPAEAARPAQRSVDPIERFALAPAHAVMLIHVNALFNTPLFDRFKKCAPRAFQELEENAPLKGIDLEKDIDQVATAPDGMAVSGFFEGKQLAQLVAQQAGADVSQHAYRGQEIWVAEDGGSCTAQIGNLLLLGFSPNCEGLVDRALDAPAPDAGTDELYGDMYFHTDLSEPLSGDDPLSRLYQSLSGITARANVWDDVALSLEGNPKSAGDAENLAEMARGALALAKGQLDEDDEKLQALADLAQVQSVGGKLQIDLALPAEQLFDRLHLPCPGLADGGAPPP